MILSPTPDQSSQELNQEALAGELESMCRSCGFPARDGLCGNCADDEAEYERAALTREAYHEETGR